MSNPSATAQAKEFYEELEYMGAITPEFRGLVGDSVWVSSNYRAYRLKDLSHGHLTSIIKRYILDDDKIPICLIDELKARLTES